MPQTILLTGAGGNVATFLRPLLREHYRVRLSDVTPITDLTDNEEYVKAALSDPVQLEEATRGIDGVIHLGGRSVEDDWPVILDANIIGTYNLFEACRHNGVKRVVFASSNHAIGMYPRQQRIDTTDRPRPDSRYGLSKVFGEAVGSLYADKHGMRVLNIRIGNVSLRPVSERFMAVWLHPEDLLQLCRIGLEHPDLHHAIVYGISDNDTAWWGNAEAGALGYRPAHRSIQFADEMEPEPCADDVVAMTLQGARFASAEFDGDLERVLRVGFPYD